MSISNISVGASFAGIQAHKARHEMNGSIMRLSSGNRTLFGADAGGASVGQSLKARSASHYVAARNAEDGISALLTAESALHEVASLATRLRELGIQADNAALLESDDISVLKAEASAIYDAIFNITNTTYFNSNVLMTENANVTFSIGDKVDSANVTAGTNTTITTGISFEESLEAFTTAVGADDTADIVLTDVALSLGNVAAGLAALKATQAVNYAMASNLEAAASRILDTDFAKETANLTKNSVLNQSAMAMVAQANQAQSAILAVLQ